jgi:hypothetical protein
MMLSTALAVGIVVFRQGGLHDFSRSVATTKRMS